MVSYTLKHYQKIKGSDTIVIQIMYFLKFLSHDFIKRYVNTLDIAFVKLFIYLTNQNFNPDCLIYIFFLFIEHEIVGDLLNIIFKLKKSDGFQGGKSFTICSIFCKHRDIF